MKIGITGGIGSGKSMVSKAFATLQIPVYDADSNAKRLMITHPKLMAQIQDLFGTEAYFPDGNLNRTHIASLAFSNANLLTQLNQIVHPAVYQDFEDWYLRQNAPYVIKEAALLLESNSYQQCDEIILVTADTQTRIERVIKRDQITENQVKERIAKQMPEEEKKKMVHHVIENLNHSEILPQILKLHHYFLSKAAH